MNWEKEQEEYLNHLRDLSAYKKLSEDINKLTGFPRIEEEIDKDKEFRKLMFTKLKDLNPKMGYSFDESIWNKYLDDTFYRFLSQIYSNSSEFQVYVSEDNSRLRGWIAYKENPIDTSIYEIKMGSFNLDNPRKNLEFIIELEQFFEDLLKNHILISWKATPSNEKVFKFYKRIIEKHKNRAKMFSDSELGKTGNGEGDKYYTFIIIGDKYIEAAEAILAKFKE